MSKHTPGKWEVGEKCYDGIRIEVDKKCSVANVWGENNEANARLIAAAPDLLEACKKAYKTLHGNPNIPAQLCVGLKQAIAKAEEV